MGGFQGCSRDKQRDIWRCARAVRKHPLRLLMWHERLFFYLHHPLVRLWGVLHVRVMLLCSNAASAFPDHHIAHCTLIPHARICCNKCCEQRIAIPSPRCQKKRILTIFPIPLLFAIAFLCLDGIILHVQESVHVSARMLWSPISFGS